MHRLEGIIKIQQFDDIESVQTWFEKNRGAYIGVPFADFRNNTGIVGAVSIPHGFRLPESVRYGN